MAALPVLLLLALAVCEWLRWPFLRGPIERRLADTLQREVQIGPGFGLRLLGSIRVGTDELSVGPPREGPMRQGAPGAPDHFLRARDLSLVVPWKTVFGLRDPPPGAPIDIRSLDVGQLDLALARRADGQANWQFGAPKAEPAEPAGLPRFERLVVHNGVVRVDDAVTDTHIDARVSTREGSGQAAPGTAAAGLQVSAMGRYGAAPLELNLGSSGLLPLAVRGTEAPTIPFTLKGSLGATRLELEGRARDVARLAALDATFRVRGPSLAAAGDALGVTLPSTARYDLRGRIRRDEAVWQADIASLAVGSSRLAGEFRYDAGPKPPLLTGALRGKRLYLPDLAPAFGKTPDAAEAAASAAGGAKPGAPAARRAETKQAQAKRRRADAKQPAAAERDASADSTRPRRVLPDREFDTPSLAAMNADVRIALDNVDLGTDQLAPFVPLEGRLRLQDRVLSVQDLLARTAGGELRGALSMDSRQPVPAWSTDLRWSDVRLESFVKASPSEKIDPDRPGSPNAYASGSLSGQARLKGRGRSAAAMLASLDGSTQWWVRDGRLSHLLLEVSGIDVAESLGILLGRDETLPVRCAVVRTGLRDGRVAMEAGVIDTQDTTLIVSGGLSFADESLALVLRAKPKDFSALALRSPVRIGGHFAEPEVSIDKGPIALRLGAAAALATVVAPLAAVLALVDFGDEEKAACQQALQRMAEPAGKSGARKK